MLKNDAKCDNMIGKAKNHKEKQEVTGDGLQNSNDPRRRDWTGDCPGSMQGP